MNTINESQSDPAEELKQRLALLRDSARQYAGNAAHLKRARALRGTRPGHDAVVWREMAALGWTGTMLPEQYGGTGLGCAEMATICEALGRSLLPEPVTAAAVLAGGAILYGDNEALKAKLLPALASGDLLPSLAWREDTHATNILAVAARAEASASGVRLSGAKRLIVGGAGADGFVVSAQQHGGLALYWVPLAAVGPRLVFHDLPDGRPAADLELDGIEVPAANRIAGPGVAELALARAYDEALIMTAAELHGLSTRTLEITTEYLRTRVQFGKPIGSFQALQHQAANLYIQHRLCQHALQEVVTLLQQPGVDENVRGALASRIKARCADASLRITRTAVQMHGAMGFADECDVGMYLRRAVTLAAWLGGADVHRRRYARLALTEIAA